MIHKWSLTTSPVIYARLYSKKPIRPATINRELALLKRMFNVAMRWKEADTNPVKDIQLLREDNVIDRTLSLAEESLILSASDETLRGVLIMLRNTLMRISETVSLRWEQIDWKNGQIILVRTKNGKVRKIPMNRELRVKPFFS